MNVIINVPIYNYIDTDGIILISIDNANCSLPVKYLAYLTLTCNNLINDVTLRPMGGIAF